MGPFTREPSLTYMYWKKKKNRACVSSLIRVYYTFKLVSTNDVNYYVSVLGLWTLPEITSAFLAICLPLAPKFFASFRPPPLRRSSGYRRHDHPINNNLPDSHMAAVAAGRGQRLAMKSWTSTGNTAVNTESSEFELADTAHIVQRVDISTKFENKDWGGVSIFVVRLLAFESFLLANLAISSCLWT